MKIFQVELARETMTFEVKARNEDEAVTKVRANKGKFVGNAVYNPDEDECPFVGIIEVK